MRILMVGLDAAGKTTILYKLKLGEGESCVVIGSNIHFLMGSILTSLPPLFPFSLQL